MAKFDVYGMCNPLFDLQAEVDETTLEQMGYAKGSMSLVDHEQQEDLIPRVYDRIVHAEAGGSGANTMIALARLGGKGVYTGHVGNDEHAGQYYDSLAKVGVKPNLGVSEGKTGVCVVMITPDAERTMCTYLGRAQALNDEDIVVEDLVESQYLYVTGYLWDTEPQKAAVTHAMAVANSAGVKVAFSLSDPFCVGRHLDAFRELVAKHVDVLFGNDHEILELAGETNMDAALEKLGADCEMVVATLGKKGAAIRHAEKTTLVDPIIIEPVDATGAGDAFAGGFLYGLSNELSIKESGRIANAVAAHVVARLGPRFVGFTAEERAAI